MTDANCEPLRGPAVYFDGTSSARNLVVVEAGDAALRILARGDGAQDQLLDEWAYAELRRMSAPDGMLRLGRHGQALLARLEIRAPELAAAIEDRADALDRSGAADRLLRRKIVALSFAAAASLVVTAVFGLPALASRIIPLVPLAAERRLGDAIDRNIRGTLDSGHLGAAFACGTAPGETAGRAALDKLVGKLEAVAALPFPLHVEVVRRAEANAMALPGGRVYVDEGLIAKAQTPDELAGVLAHEIGHVAHRDGTRTVLQTAGLSFLFGMMLGDFVGGGAVVIAARTVLKSSYSRREEAAADAYSVDLMTKASGDPHALAAILKRIVGDKKEGMKLLLDHPETKDRIAAIDGVPVVGTPVPLLDAADWGALKQVCAPLPANATGNIISH
ncbi:MAG TPA: M48 family metallopeptidase [Xanthobacteraceae bacterium]|nr:M48 family metallopeptidase [Xanthobacteraceae bacterium]